MQALQAVRHARPASEYHVLHPDADELQLLGRGGVRRRHAPACDVEHGRAFRAGVPVPESLNLLLEGLHLVQGDLALDLGERELDVGKRALNIPDALLEVYDAIENLFVCRERWGRQGEGGGDVRFYDQGAELDRGHSKVIRTMDARTSMRKNGSFWGVSCSVLTSCVVWLISLK